MEVGWQAEASEAEDQSPVREAVMSLQEVKWGLGRPVGPGGRRQVHSIPGIRSALFLFGRLGKFRLVLCRWHTDAQSMASREVLLGPMVV